MNHASSPTLTTTAEWLSFAEPLTASNLMGVMVATCKAAADAGFAGVEIPLPHAEVFFDELSSTYWEEARQAMRETGAPCLSIHGPTLPALNISDDDAMRRVLPYAGIANRLGVSALVVHPTWDSHPHVCTKVPKLLRRDITLSNAIGDELDDGISLAVENLPTYGLSYLRHLMSKINHPRVGVCFDTGHWNVRPEGTIQDAVQSLGDRITHLHLSDNDGLCDAHRPPGGGNFPWAEWAASLNPDLLHKPMLVELSVPLLRDHKNAIKLATEQWQEAVLLANNTLKPVWNAILTKNS